MPQRPMLNLELGKCYEVTHLQDWRDLYPRKVKIIERKHVHSDRIHSYGTTSPTGFLYIWDYGWAKGSFGGCDGGYSIVAARELKGTELEEFEAELRKAKER